MSRRLAFAAAIASKTTAAGSAPCCARMTSTPAREAHTSSCSTAAARNVSAAHTSGARPSSFISRASFPTVVVFPVPFTPTMRITAGLDAAVAPPPRAPAAVRIDSISSFTSSRRLRPVPARSRTARTMRSAAATPTSAPIKASSSASYVSRDAARVLALTAPNRSAAGALTVSVLVASTDSAASSMRPSSCAFVRDKPERSLSRKPISVCFRAVHAPDVADGASTPRARRGAPCVRPARRPSER